MLRATEVLRAGHWDGTPADRVQLDYEHRTRRRITLRGMDGLEFLLDLVQAQLLRTGDALRLENGRLVAVEAAPERLLEITCGDSRMLVRIAWHLGNRHLATEIGDRVIHIRDDHVIADMVHGLGADVRAVERAFNPEGGAYGEGAVHGHRHAASPPHMHPHGLPHSQSYSPDGDHPDHEHD